MKNTEALFQKTTTPPPPGAIPSPAPGRHRSDGSATVTTRPTAGTPHSSIALLHSKRCHC